MTQSADSGSESPAERETWWQFLDRVAAEGQAELTVRELLRKMGQWRRGALVLDRIDRAFKARNLEAIPPIDAVPFDSLVTIRLRSAMPSRSDSPDVPETTAEPSDAGLPGWTASESALRIGTLMSANTSVANISPDASIEQAMAMMQRDDYSQLAVVTGPRSLKGAVSWESIAVARAWKEVLFVRDALEESPLTLRADADLLRTAAAINETGFAFVLDNTDRISGIVTSADLGKVLVELANPYLLVGEIEQSLRHLAECLPIADFAGARDPGDTSREVSAVADLTVGELVRLLEKPANWSRLELPFDRGVCVERFQQFNAIRNEVMHFSPDPMSDLDLAILHSTRVWLLDICRRLDDRESDSPPPTA